MKPSFLAPRIFVYMHDQSEIRALISLLDDPDEKVYHQIEQKILSFGNPIIPQLEDAWEEYYLNNLTQERIEDIIHQIQFEDVCDELKDWKKRGCSDLLKGAIIVSKYQYPDLNEDEIYTYVHRIQQDVWLEINDSLTALEKVNVINRMFYDIHGFSGNKKHFHSPQNSYINSVIELKKGNPLTLSILYVYMAQNLNIPIYGINLPQHFIMAYLDDMVDLKDLSKVRDEDILFYINPFSIGNIFSRREVDLFIQELKLEPKEEYYKPCDNLVFIQRLIHNLIFAYTKLGYDDKIEELRKMLDILNMS